MFSSIGLYSLERHEAEDGATGKYCRMIFDSGAGCTAMPASVGEGYKIVQDEWTGEQYGGAMEGMKASDEGHRVIINIIDNQWKEMPMSHRVVEKMRHPLISAGETVDKHNLVFMSRGMSFIVPESSDFGWNLYEAVWRLAHEHGTQDSVEMYRDQSNVFVFDSWVQPPKGLHSVSSATSDRVTTEGGA